MKKVIVLAGPTASGKTSLSIKIAKHFNFDVINGDSVAIYRDLDIGSAKIRVEEADGVKHHLISYVDPKVNYSVYDYQKDVRKVIDKLECPFIVGGSGFYIKASLFNYEFLEEIDQELDYSFDEKVEIIKRKDPNLEIDFSNERRVNRAFKMIMNHQLPSSKVGKDEPLYDILILYLDMPRNKQKELMIQRVLKMLEEGLIQEVQDLRVKGIYLYDIIGYREINYYLDGKMTLEEAIEKIVNVTYKFSKRQKTYFLNQFSPVLLNPLSNSLLEDSIKVIEEFLKKWDYI